MTDLRCLQGQPLAADLYVEDDDGGRLPLPAGAPRMHLRERPASPLALDVAGAGYLTRDDEAHEVRLRIPGSVTATLPGVLVFDLWLDDDPVLDGRVFVRRAVTR